MMRTRDINGPSLYDPSDDLEVHEYNIACVMYSCGLDGSTVENVNADSVIAAINSCYSHKNPENVKSDSPSLISAASLLLRRNHSLLISRLRMSYMRRSIAKGILENG